MQLIVRIRDGYGIWRRLGVVAGTRAAIRALVRPLRMRVRRVRLRLRPIRASRDEVSRALGSHDVISALQGPVRDALPTVTQWRSTLAEPRAADVARLVDRADAVASLRFDLLGSGQTDLPRPVDWQRDFKHGRSWPLTHLSRVPIVFGDGSDIKVPWELSRFQHAPTLAAAWRATGDRRYLDALGDQLVDWIDANPVEFGANWACTMDVAIRAANWVAALALCDDAPAVDHWQDKVIASLLLHGRFIRTHLEWGEVRGNHYLSDVVGLLVVAALFSGGREGRAWADWATGELEREMAHQVRSDGSDHEASLPYHRLVCELFICGTQAADALCPGQLSESYRGRLSLMLQLVADTTRPDGLSPQIGDADSGRFLPLADYGVADFRDHSHLFTQAGVSVPSPRGTVAYQGGGYYVARAGDAFLLVRCGDVGLGGIGAHAHNDQLSFELCLGEQPMVVDPGSFLYTASPVERNRFRSTASHSTLQLDAEEQAPLESDYLFRLEDVARAETQLWKPTPEGALWEGRHHGYERLRPPATVDRRIESDLVQGEILILDSVTSDGPHEMTWTFPLAPAAVVEASDGHARARWPSGVQLTVSAPGCASRCDPGWVSPSYGVREPAAVLRFQRRSRPGRDEQRLTLTFGRVASDSNRPGTAS